MSTVEAARPAASVEDLLAALVFAVVSLLLVATLPSEQSGRTTANADAAAASRSSATRSSVRP